MSMRIVSELTKMSIMKLRSRLQRIEMVLPNIPMFGVVKSRGPAAFRTLYSAREREKIPLPGVPGHCPPFPNAEK
jgi:hypothetical protein